MNGVAVDIVVEIAPGCAALARLFDDPFRPRLQPFVGIAAPIFPFAAVKADVGEWPNGDALTCRSRHVMDAERGAVAVEQSEGRGLVPAPVAELEDVAEIGWGKLEETLEALE